MRDHGFGAEDKALLTRREHDVLRLMVSDKSNKEIAASLEISAGTVKIHVYHILLKLRTKSRREAVNKGLKRGLLRGKTG